MGADEIVLNILKPILGNVYYDEALQGQHLPYSVVTEDDVEPVITKDGYFFDFSFVKVLHSAEKKSVVKSMSQASRVALSFSPDGINFIGGSLISQSSFTESRQGRVVFTIEQIFKIITL